MSYDTTTPEHQLRLACDRRAQLEDLAAHSTAVATLVRSWSDSNQQVTIDNVVARWGRWAHAHEAAAEALHRVAPGVLNERSMGVGAEAAADAQCGTLDHMGLPW